MCIVRGFALLLSLVLLPGCAALGTENAPDKPTAEQVAQLEKRAEERWQAMIAKDFARVYDYSTPVFRSSFPKNLYVLKFSSLAEWELTGLEYVEYDARAAVASVAVRVMSKPSKQTQTASEYGAVPLTITEKWFLIDGQWWYSAND